MSVYKNQQAHRPIQTIEFSQASGSELAFVRIADGATKDAFLKWLATQAGHQLIADTNVAGKPTLIVKIPEGHTAFLGTLRERGDTFDLARKDQGVDPWVVRSLLGFGGQTLQLASAFLRPGAIGKGFWHRVDMPVFIFAASNLTANAINLVYKAQDQEDPNKLRFLKQKTNEDVASALPNGTPVIDVDDKRMATRPQAHKKSTVNDFMRKYSVNIGELGLRYLGAFGLALDLHTQNIQNRLTAGKSWLALNPSKWKQYAGLSSIAGKTVALNSKIEDPYDPTPKSWWDKAREKWTFFLGGLIEVTSFSALAYDNFAHTAPVMKDGVLTAAKHGIVIGGRPYRDWLGGIGASMFVTGYIVRSWAKYGKRHVNMNELAAHVSDTLAAVPPEKVPQLLADITSDLHDHFQGKDEIDYSALYTRILTDLEHQHHLTILNGKCVSTTQANSQAAESTPETAPQSPKTTIFSAQGIGNMSADKINNISAG